MPPFTIGAALLEMFSRSSPPPRRRRNKPEVQEAIPKGKKLTFGVELEFLLAFQDPSNNRNPDPDTQDPRQVRGIVRTRTYQSKLELSKKKREEAHQHITDTLVQTGIAARNEWITYFPKRPWQFVVGHDDSVQFLGNDRGYSFMPTEVRSPPFYYQKESLLQVSGALQSLTSNYRIVCNNTTGVHVHIGYGGIADDESKTGCIENNWHPRVASRLMAILWVFQDCLDTLHPVRRRSNRLGSTHCESLSTASKLAFYLRDEPDSKVKGLHTILALRDETDCDELVKLTQAQDPSSRLSYNIDNLAIGKKVGKTFECRQHCGTLSPDKILAWINICAGLVEFADTVEDDLLEDFLKSHVGDELEDYTAIDLLRAIGLPDEAEFYSRIILENEKMAIYDLDSLEKDTDWSAL